MIAGVGIVIMRILGIVALGATLAVAEWWLESNGPLDLSASNVPRPENFSGFCLSGGNLSFGSHIFSARDRPGTCNFVRRFLSVSLKCLHDRDAREPNRSDLIRVTLAGFVPRRRVLLVFGMFADICKYLAQRGDNYLVRENDWSYKI
jgi:hypothetical protein